MIETNGFAAAGISGDPSHEFAEPFHPFAHGRPGVVPVPGLAAGTGRLPAEELPHRLRAARVRRPVTGGPTAEDIEEAFHVAPEPPPHHTVPIVRRRGDRPSCEHPPPAQRDVARAAD